LRIYGFVGDSGTSIISRVMGLILASLATASALAGIEAYFPI
jgi:multiple antibiotic resistance protein